MSTFQEITVTVHNISNDVVHFKRSVELPFGVSFDYNSTTQVLLGLYSSLKVYITYDIKLFEHKDIK